MKNISLFVLIIFTLPFGLYGQINVPSKLKEKAKQRVEERVDRAIDKGLDKTEEELEKMVKKDKKEDGTEEEPEKGNDPENDEGSEKSLNTSDSVKTSLISTTQYDFIPGDQILVYEDFSQDKIGEFPSLWTTNGSGEVKTLNIATGNWFHMNGDDAVYCFMKTIDFPANFIVEFDLVPDQDFTSFEFTLYNDIENQELNDNLYPGDAGLHFQMKYDGWEVKGYKDDLDWNTAESQKNAVEEQRVNHVIIWVQDRRVRIYHKGAKVIDAPTVIHKGVKFNRIRFSGWDNIGKPFLTGFKVTTASPDMRHKLLTEGKMVTYGITFDSGKDLVKPESHATIKEIAGVLIENPAIRIKITGHTDSDGNDNANLELSARRATNVKKYLVSQFGIAETRIETAGKGEAEPIAANNNAQNKAKNRRVEIIKL
ncbi:MAG TPA: OmpA family protein [Bacteroidales bacterium]|nr:OmpA family protein [Bacteroidales bacterium]HRZ50181.1 OmpA family protein [Bacteroidales bacterium]